MAWRWLATKKLWMLWFDYIFLGKIPTHGVCFKDENDDYGHKDFTGQTTQRIKSLSKPIRKLMVGKTVKMTMLLQKKVPPSKIRRVSFFKQQKGTSQSPNDGKIDSWKESRDDYASKNEFPPSKSRSISSQP
ncbi:hypothetical protein HS088_TW06G00720 [Tripterygium wilfordii]|uniref:Uncharacterized protein n=1 Tax=Tripterygium wilfordii TaxID=458696 RepID=A0A7J7DJU1_TRIWF|nr:hypothetical protein HS088_TW06G00720 [Tripterygium wilfordii]